MSHRSPHELTLALYGKTREAKEQVMAKQCQTMTLTELFSITQPLRQRYIDTMVEVRDDFEGFLLAVKAGGKTIPYKVNPKRPESKLSTRPKRVGVVEGIYLFSKYGTPPELEQDCPERYGLIYEVETETEEKGQGGGSQEE